MKKFAYILAFGAAGLTLFYSCSKKYDKTGSITTGQYFSAENLFASLAVHAKVVTIDAQRDTSFFGNSGTRYSFYANTLMTAGGALVTGKVQLQVAEYLQKGDMLFSKMLPVSNDEPLISGGEINVSASQDGQKLFMRPGATFDANMPQPGGAPTGMLFFTAQTATDTTQTKANWINTTDTLSEGAIVINGDTLKMISDSLTMCNADRFMTSPNYQSFSVTVSVIGATLPSANKVFGYTLYDNFKGEQILGRIGGYADGVFTESHVPDIPVHFGIFALIDGYFYGGIIGVTPANGSNYAVTLVKMDPNTFKTQLNGM